MKKNILISLLVVAMGMIAFMGCERPEPIVPNEGPQHHRAEDSLINQQGDTAIAPQIDSGTTQTADTCMYLPPDSIRPVEHWRAVTNSYFDYSEGVYHNEPYTYAYMDIYPQAGLLRANDVSSNDNKTLAFYGGDYWGYSMSGDTIRVFYDDPEWPVPENMQRWLVSHISADTMYWRFLGGGIPENIPNYTFCLIGVEQ